MTAARWLMGGVAAIALHLGVAQVLMASAHLPPRSQTPDPVIVELVPPPPKPNPVPAPVPDPVPEPVPEPAPAMPNPGFPPAVFEIPDLPPPAEAPVETPTETPREEPDKITDAAPKRPVARPTAPTEPARKIVRQPRAAPAQPSHPRETSRTEPQPSRSQPAAKAASTPAAQPSAATLHRWQADVGTRIARHMKRTRISGARGALNVSLTVTIGADGRAVARLASATGNPAVDAALTRQAARLPRLPAPPDGRGQTFVLPIQITR